MTYKEIQDLLKLVSKSDLAEVRLKDGEFELTIRTKNYSKSKSGPHQILAQPSIVPTLSQSPQVVEQATTNEGSSEKQSSSSTKDESESNANLKEVKSPIVGTFYRSPSPDKPAFVAVGDSIQEGSVVCIIEAMKLFNEIESEVSGKIVKVLVEDASPVEYDQALFLVDPNG